MKALIACIALLTSGLVAASPCDVNQVRSTINSLSSDAYLLAQAAGSENNYQFLVNETTQVADEAANIVKMADSGSTCYQLQAETKQYLKPVFTQLQYDIQATHANDPGETYVWGFWVNVMNDHIAFNQALYPH